MTDYVIVSGTTDASWEIVCGLEVHVEIGRAHV